MFGNGIMKCSLIAGNPLEINKLQRKDEICLYVNVQKLLILGNQQPSSEEEKVRRSEVVFVGQVPEMGTT